MRIGYSDITSGHDLLFAKLALQLHFFLTSESVDYHDMDEVMDGWIVD